MGCILSNISPYFIRDSNTCKNLSISLLNIYKLTNGVKILDIFSLNFLSTLCCLEVYNTCYWARLMDPHEPTNLHPSSSSVLHGEKQVYTLLEFAHILNTP